MGFSDHAPHVFEEKYISPIRMKMDELEDYVSTIDNLKRDYKNEIEIYIGLEMEFLPVRFEKTMKELEQYPLDYMILGSIFWMMKLDMSMLADLNQMKDFFKFMWKG